MSAVKASALSLAVRVPAGWKQHHSLCHAGLASGAERRRPVRCVGAFWSGWFWGFGSALHSKRDQLPGSDPATLILDSRVLHDQQLHEHRLQRLASFSGIVHIRLHCVTLRPNAYHTCGTKAEALRWTSTAWPLLMSRPQCDRMHRPCGALYGRSMRRRCGR